ncbi:MAG: hypothetical protein LC685_01650 [Actinobacteria bacterium]|nr:hypothetical protein [Actinomycetota bacterium]
MPATADGKPRNRGAFHILTQNRAPSTPHSNPALPTDVGLSDLVGELSTRSEEFRQLWARHDVRFHVSGVKRLHHPQVGEMELRYEGLDVVSDTDQTI